MDYTCRYCKRNAQEVGTQHFVDEDDKIVCQDCGVDKSKPSPEIPQPEQQSQQAPQIDITYFQVAMFEVLQERVKQVVEQGYNPSVHMHRNISDFAVLIERDLNMLKHKACSSNPQEVADARKALIQLLATGLGFLESHPLPSRG